MKIWILQTGEPLHCDKDNLRPMRAINLANSLVKKNYDVVIWSSSFNHQKKYHRSKKYKVIKIQKNLEIRLIPSPGYKKHIGLMRLIDHFLLSWNLKKLLKKEKNLPDVAFIGYPPIETAAVMSKWLKKQNIPIVLDVKDLWPSMFVDYFPKIIQPIVRIIFYPYFYLARRAGNNSISIISMTKPFLNWFLDFAKKRKSKNNRVFPLTSPKVIISKKNFSKAEQWWFGQGVDGTKPVVLFIGSFMSVFDFDPIANSAKKLKHIQFVLCGDGDYLESVKKKMIGLNNVIFPGRIDRTKIEVISKKSIASLIPYKNINNYIMNTPNKVIDSLLLGLPILSPLTGEVAKMIKNYKIGFKYNNTKILSHYIEILNKKPFLQKEISKNALKLYKEKFEFNKIYSNLVNHLETIYKNSRIKNDL